PISSAAVPRADVRSCTSAPPLCASSERFRLSRLRWRRLPGRAAYIQHDAVDTANLRIKPSQNHDVSVVAYDLAIVDAARIRPRSDKCLTRAIRLDGHFPWARIVMVMHHDAGAGSADLIGGYAPTEKMATALACRNRLGARSIAISMVRHQSPSAGRIPATQPR